MQEDSGRPDAPVLAGRYRLRSQLGRGGTARVLRAWDARLDRQVAVKLFHQHADPLGLRRFATEVRLLATLRHRGLVTVHDAGTHDDQPYLVLELIDGPHLGQRIDERPLTPGEVRDLGARLAETLAYIHGHGVVHRDVKPANILLGPDGHPRLADFGLARLLESTGITASDTVLGTAAYLSPEQVLGEEVGPPADVYGLGLVLVEGLTGHVEYPGTSAESVMARINRPPRVPDDVPPALAHTLRAMTRTDPAARPDAAGCAAMFRDGTAAAAGRRLLPWPRRHLGRRTAIAVTAGVTASALAITYPLAPASTPIDTYPEPSRSGPAQPTVQTVTAVARTDGTADHTRTPAPAAADPPAEDRPAERAPAGTTVTGTPAGGPPAAGPPAAPRPGPTNAGNGPGKSKKPKEPKQDNGKGNDDKTKKNAPAPVSGRRGAIRTRGIRGSSGSGCGHRP